MLRWPRHYAADIAKLDNLEERRHALAQVPAHLQDIVKTHLQITWEARKRERAKAEPIQDTRP